MPLVPGCVHVSIYDPNVATFPELLVTVRLFTLSEQREAGTRGHGMCQYVLVY